MKNTICLIGLLFLAISLQAESAGVDLLFSCKSCNNRFMGFVVKGAVGGRYNPAKNNISVQGKEYQEVFQGTTKTFALSTSPVEEVDSDMCYVPFDYNQYTLAVLTCPHCGFSFLNDHYFSLSVSPKVKLLVDEMLKPGMVAFQDEFLENLKKIDRLERAVDLQKEKTIDRSLIVTSAVQKQIPAHIKYYNAIQSYRWLNYSPAFISRLALNGAWAYRTEVCLPFVTGSDEFISALRTVDRKLADYSEALSRTQWENPRGKNEVLRQALTSVLKEDQKLTQMDRFVMANMLVGICDRLGRYHDTRHWLDIASRSTDGNERLDIYIRKQGEWLKHEQDFLRIAVDEKMKGLSGFALSRRSVFPEVYLLGDLTGRQGQIDTARYWFTLLTELKDTPKPLRELCKTRLAALPANTSGAVPPRAQALAIQIKDGLGTIEYFARIGKARKDLGAPLCEKVMKKIGYALIVYKDDFGFYPDSYQDLWDDEYLMPGEVNYFCCPQSGKPYHYAQPKIGFMVWPILCDAMSHPWAGEQGQYGVFHTNGLFKIEDGIPAEIQP